MVVTLHTVPVRAIIPRRSRRPGCEGDETGAGDHGHARGRSIGDILIRSRAEGRLNRGIS